MVGTITLRATDNAAILFQAVRDSLLYCQFQTLQFCSDEVIYNFNVYFYILVASEDHRNFLLILRDVIYFRKAILYSRIRVQFEILSEQQLMF